MSLETKPVQKDSKFSILHPFSSLTHHHKTDPNEHIPDQLLRLRIINGELPIEASNIDTYAVVSIGRQSARTKVVKNSNKPVFEENFAIGYQIEDHQSEIVIDLFEKGTLTDKRIGEYRLKLMQVDPPKDRRAAKKDKGTNNREVVSKSDEASHNAPLPPPVPSTGAAVSSKSKEKWVNAAPREAALLDRTGTRVGTLWIIVRREMRMHGRVMINVGDLNLNTHSPSAFSFDAARPYSIVAKLGQERNESSPVEPQQNSVPFAYHIEFDVNDTNNISDIFFELWQDGKAIAEARLPLYEARKGIKRTLFFVTPFGGHDITSTNLKNDIGTLNIDSEFEWVANAASDGHA